MKNALKKLSKAGNLLATVASIEILRCMCGTVKCVYCENKISKHYLEDMRYCPYCGYPLSCWRPE